MQSSGIRFLLLIFGFFASYTTALYDENDSVMLLTEKNFKKEVLLTERVVLVEFFAPWCGHCQKLVPEYKKVAENLKGLAKVVAIDCDDDSNGALCAAYNVKGYPTIKLFPSQSVPDKKNPGAYTKKPKDYQGPRTAKAIVDFVLPEIPSFVQPITNKNPTKKSMTIDEFLEKDNETLSKVILFTNKQRTTTLYKALSVDFHDRLLFGEVRHTDSLVLKRFGVDSFPKLIVIPKGKSDVITFDGKLKHETLFEFLNGHALPFKPKIKKTEKPNETPKKDSEEIPETFDPEILEARTQTDLEKNCLSTSNFCIFTFSTLELEFPESVSEHEANLAIVRRVKEKLHKSFAGKIKLGFVWFNSLYDDAKKMIKDFKIADLFPNLVILNPKKQAYRALLGPFDEESIERFIKDAINGRVKSFSYDFPLSLKGKDSETKTQENITTDKEPEKTKEKETTESEDKDDTKAEKKENPIVDGTETEKEENASKTSGDRKPHEEL
ncbi:hypothetical protein G9A89_009431 [Geosiphon pyriformis]|nr:hypothetical protein G9A89_009431 [Geosiphon pyriformis]